MRFGGWGGVRMRVLGFGAGFRRWAGVVRAGLCGVEGPVGVCVGESEVGEAL